MTRLLAAIAVPVVVVLGLVVWGPAQDGRDALASIATTEPVPVPFPAGVGTAPGPVLSPPESATSRSSTSRPGASVTGASAADDTALAVSIDAMFPSVVPLRGPVTIRGRITNTTDETWTGINVYPCTSSQPMTTTAELRAAVASDPALGVCTRTDYFVEIGDLEPGETGRYSLRITREALRIPTAPGVYWMNVQALGSSSAGRDTVSDGRARSFLPMADRSQSPVSTSVVIPVRRSTLREADGRLAAADEWAVDLAAGGRLHNLLAFIEHAGDTPVSLLIDPAVLDAVRQLASGNPARDLDPTPGESKEGEEEPAEEPAEDDPAEDADARSAQEWLDRMVDAAGKHSVLALPYGDLDLAASARFDSAVYQRAVAASEQTLEELDIAATPAVVPPSGLLSPEALALSGSVDSPTTLLSTDSLPEELATAEVPPATVTVEGRTIGVYDDAVGLGGPAPGNRMAAIALRQRVLAEAALRSLGEDERPLVVNLPGDFDPGRSSAGFFRGLERRFLLPAADLVGPSTDAPEVEVSYPQRQVERELWATNFENGEDLRTSGLVLDRLLPENNTVARVVADEALGAMSYNVREDPYAAALASAASARWIDALLAKVTITAPEFVILSSDSGPFSITVTNGLDQPIRIRIRASTPDDLVIRAPELIELEAGKQQAVPLSARSGAIGVHPVTLLATDEELVPLGASEEISIRSNQVGRVIWVIMGAGGGILLLAIVIRLTRRIRSARAS